MRTLFIGSTPRGLDTLAALYDLGADMVGVISLAQHAHELDRAEGRIRQLVTAHRTPLFETADLKDRDYVELVREELRPEVIFVIGCRLLLPLGVIDFPAKGALAVHDSLLPAYRGFAPLNWAIINGEEETGATLFHLSEGMDEGDIVDQVRVRIGPDDDAPSVYDRICRATTDMVRRAYPLLEAGLAPNKPQDHSHASYTCSRTPADGLIDWTAATAEIHNLVRALTHPFPGAHTFLRRRRLTVLAGRPKADAPRYVGRIPGRVVGLDRNSGAADVLTGDGVYTITQLALDDGSRVEPAATIGSVRVSLGPDSGGEEQ